MPDLATLNYAPLEAKPSKSEIADYRSAREIFGYDALTGFDEQKAPTSKKGLFGKLPNNDVWERRYRLNAFAELNEMTYVYRSDPGRWPGKGKKVTTLSDVIRGSDSYGRQMMTCYEQDVRRQGPPISTMPMQGDTQGIFLEFVDIAIQAGLKGPTIFLRHRRKPDKSVSDDLLANYTVDNLLARHAGAAAQKALDEQIDSVRPFLTGELLDRILSNASNYDLHLSGGWLYLMQPVDANTGAKKNADPASLRERFEIAAQIAAVLPSTA